MTATQITVATAPRDLEGLKKAGRFNLRVLAQELGIFNSETDKTSFMQASNDQQAETVLKYLQEKDGGPKNTGKGGGGATGRSPSTKNAGKGPAGKATGEAAAGTGGGGAAAASGTGGSATVGAGAEKILTKLQELIEKVDGFQGSVDNLAERVSSLEGISAGTNRFVALSIGLAGKLAEQVLGASLEQILDVTLEDMPTVEAAMKRMAPAEDEEGEDSDEGNEEE